MPTDKQSYTATVGCEVAGQVLAAGDTVELGVRAAQWAVASGKLELTSQVRRQAATRPKLERPEKSDKGES